MVNIINLLVLKSPNLGKLNQLKRLFVLGQSGQSDFEASILRDQATWNSHCVDFGHSRKRLIGDFHKIWPENWYIFRTSILDPEDVH